MMIFPCCKTELPEHLGGVELVTCSCGQVFSPAVIIEYNELLDIATEWAKSICGKVFMRPEPEYKDALVDLLKRSNKYARYNIEKIKESYE
jgi:hypothetical protein